MWAVHRAESIPGATGATFTPVMHTHLGMSKKKCLSEGKPDPTHFLSAAHLCALMCSKEDCCCLGPRDLPQLQPHPVTRPESLGGMGGGPGQGWRWWYSLRPPDLGVGDGTDEGHHPAAVQEEPDQRDGRLLLFSADFAQDVRCGCRDGLQRNTA